MYEYRKYVILDTSETGSIDFSQVLETSKDTLRLNLSGSRTFVKYDGPIEAPIKKDQKIATLRVVYDQELVGEYDLLSSKEIKKVNFLTRLLKSINYLIWGDV